MNETFLKLRAVAFYAWNDEILHAWLFEFNCAEIFFLQKSSFVYLCQI